MLAFISRLRLADPPRRSSRRIPSGWLPQRSAALLRRGRNRLRTRLMVLAAFVLTGATACSRAVENVPEAIYELTSFAEAENSACPVLLNRTRLACRRVDRLPSNIQLSPGQVTNYSYFHHDLAGTNCGGKFCLTQESGIIYIETEFSRRLADVVRGQRAYLILRHNSDPVLIVNGTEAAATWVSPDDFFENRTQINQMLTEL